MLDHRVEFLPLLQGDKKLKSFSIRSDYSSKTVKGRRVLGRHASFDMGIRRECENLLYNCARQT
jgi:hypothetical protein